MSSSLLASHFRVMTLFMRDGAMFPQVRNPLREKLLMHLWFEDNMTRADRDAVAHSFVSMRRGRWFEGHFNPQLSAVLGAAAAKVGAHGDPSAAPHRASADPHSAAQCDGRVCAGYCPYLRRLIHEVPCSFTWAASPEAALVDRAGLPSHAFLCIRSPPYDARVEERQQRLLSQRAARVAVQLLAQFDGEDGQDGVAEEAGWVMDDAPLESAIRVSMSAQVNCEFERLMGYSQAEVRASFMSSGERAVYGLLRSDDWAQLMDLTREVKLMRRTEFRIRCTALTRAQQEVPCVLCVACQLDAEGKPSATFLSFIPTTPSV